MFQFQWFNLSDNLHSDIRRMSFPMKLRSMKNFFDVIGSKYLTQLAAATKHDQKEKVYNFDLRYAIKRFNPNFELVRPILTIESENNKHKEPVFIFPGFEGRIDSVDPLIQNLNRTVHCLQYPFEKSKNNIPELAASIIQILKAYRLGGDRMNVIGHSFGGIVAVETVRQLEAEGKNIRLCLTDSTPYAVKEMTTQAFGDVRRCDEFENNLLINIANCIEFQDQKLLKDLLAKCSDWEERMNAIFPVVAEKTQRSTEHLKIMSDGIYNVLHAIFYYGENDVRLECETTLIRSSVKVLPFPDDFKISKFFKKPVREFHTDGHHLNMLKFPKIANLVNDAFAE